MPSDAANGFSSFGLSTIAATMCPSTSTRAATPSHLCPLMIRSIPSAVVSARMREAPTVVSTIATEATIPERTIASSRSSPASTPCRPRKTAGGPTRTRIATADQRARFARFDTTATLGTASGTSGAPEND